MTENEQTDETEAPEKADEKPAASGGGVDDSAEATGGAGDRDRDQYPGTDDVAKLRKEAAGYRTKLRKSEAEVAAITAQLGEAHRTLVERQVADPPEPRRHLAHRRRAR